MLTLAMLAAMLAPAAAPAAVATPVPGTVTVVLAGGADDADQPFADAVQDALGAASFTALPVPGHSRYLAEVSIARQQNGVVATRAPKDPASAGIGSWGPAIRVPLGSKKTVLRGLVLTSLTVRIVTRADRQPVWTGSAITAQADGAPVAAKLARAAVASFPQTGAAPGSGP